MHRAHFASLILSLILASPAAAQFEAVLNVPPDAAPETVGDGVQLNLFEGGSLGGGFVAGHGSEVNVYGGEVGGVFNAASGSITNISGGVVGGGFTAGPESEVRISGGRIGPQFVAAPGSRVTLVGDEFMLDDVAIDALPDELPKGSVLAGVLADGSVTVFSGIVSDYVWDRGAFQLEEAAVPVAVPRIFAVPYEPAPPGLRGGQTLILGEGGSLPKYYGVVNAKLNVEGGVIGEGLEAVASELKVSGGIFSDGVRIYSGSTIDVSGGEFEKTLDVLRSEVNISDGKVRSLSASGASSVNVSGGEFGEIKLFDGSKGVVTDGTITRDILLRRGSELSMSAGSANYLSIADESVATVSGGVVEDGATARHGGKLVVSGGKIRGDVRVERDCSLLVAGGRVAEGGSVESWGEVVVSGGTLGDHFEMGGRTTISGGAVGSFASAGIGSKVSITGGRLGSHFDVGREGVVVVSGGVLGKGFRAASESHVTLVGNEFQLNGEPIDSLPEGLPEGSLFTAVLADGAPFALWGGGDLESADLIDDVIAPGVLSLVQGDVPAPRVGTIRVPAEQAPQGIRRGESLALSEGGELGDSFTALGASLEISGGQLGEGMELIGSTAQITSGTIGRHLRAYDGSNLSISGGEFGARVDLSAGSTAHITGGEFADAFCVNEGSRAQISGGVFIADDRPNPRSGWKLAEFYGFSLRAEQGSVVEISGGEFGPRFTADSGSELFISGGAFGESFRVYSGASLHLAGSDFALDGVAIEGLSIGEEFSLLGTDALLSGVLADGSPFAFYLQSQPDDRTELAVIESGAVVTLTLTVPEPCTLVIASIVLGVWTAFGRTRNESPT